MLASLIAAIVSGETLDAAKRARAAAIAYLLCAVLAICGVGFLVGAGYIWTAERYGSLRAAMCFGAGFLFLAILILLVHKIVARARAREAARRRSSELTAVGVTAALAALPMVLRSKVAIIGPLVALAAYAIYRENRGTDGDDPKSGPD
jgi:undecaprenyl pyrophosphate phosphatase UppP